MPSEPPVPSPAPLDAPPDLLACEGAGRSALRRAALLLAALACFALGLVGWLVPVVTGVPFYVAGLVLLAKALPAAGRWINGQERRLPLRWRLLLRPRWAAARRAENRRRSGAAPGPGGDPGG